MPEAKPVPQPESVSFPLAASNDNADLVAALAAAREHFAGPMEATTREMRALLAGRRPRQLVGREYVSYLTLRAAFHELAIAQRDFAQAHLSGRQAAAPAVAARA